MQRLENRIAALEQAQPAQKITLILRRFVSPAHLGGEIDYLGNPPNRPKAREVEFSKKEVLREEVKIY